MISIAIKTDQPQASLYLLKDTVMLAEYTWEANRTLARDLLKKLHLFLEQNAVHSTDIEGLVIYEGPGSFTGLRIGGSVINAMAYGLEVPVVGAGGEDWLKTGATRLVRGENDTIAKLMYGGQIHITVQKK
jgi:tRNA threonylcarbamoyladenosine biosynthesis protein TsaB